MFAPNHIASFENNKLRRWTHDKRRVGRPRANWTEETIKEIWNAVKRTNERFRFQAFDENNNDMIELIKNFEVRNDNYVPPPP